MSVIVRVPMDTLDADPEVWTREDLATKIDDSADLFVLGDANRATGVTKGGAYLDYGEEEGVNATTLAMSKAGAVPVDWTNYRVRGVRLFIATRSYGYLPAPGIGDYFPVSWRGALVEVTGTVGTQALPDLGAGTPAASWADVEWRGDWRKQKTPGVEWAEDNTDDLELVLQMSNGPGFPHLYLYPQYTAAIAEAGIEFDAVLNPVAEHLAPASGFVDDLTVASWSMPGNDPQTAFLARVWTEADAEDVGFDPDTTPPLYEVAGVSTQALTLFDPTRLTRGANYYWSVRVSKDFNGATWSSEWPDPIEVTYNERVAVVVDAPTGSIVDTSRPLVEWTSTDAQYGAGQSAWEARIYREPLAGWPASGLPPGTPYDQATANNDAKEWRVVHQLEPATTYRAYVRVRALVSATSTGLWSAWAFSEFTNDTPADPGPPFTATFDEDYPRGHLVLTPIDDVPPDHYYTLERSFDGGDSWATFTFWGIPPGGDEFAHFPSTGLIFADTDPHDLYDQDVVMGRPVLYRAFAIAAPDGFDIATAPTLADPGAFPVARHLYLADPLTFAPPVAVSTPDEWLAGTTAAPVGVFRPLVPTDATPGSARYVVQRGIPGGDLMGVNFQFVTTAAYDAIRALLLSGVTLALFTEGRNYYVRGAGDLAWRDHLTDAKYCAVDGVYTLAVPFAQVADPTLAPVLT